MKLSAFGINLSLEREMKTAQTLSIDTLIKRLQVAMETGSGVAVTAENCMRSPTVHAIVTSISKRLQVTPVRVMQKLRNDKGRLVTSPVDHPLNNLFMAPNKWQSRADYWGDLGSTFVRYGNYYAFMGKGRSGPPRWLYPLDASTTEPKLEENWTVSYRGMIDGKTVQDFDEGKIHHIRGAARNFYKGDSPVDMMREAIGYEIAAEMYGATVFGNGASPSLILEYDDKSKGHKTDEERQDFVDDFQRSYSRRNRSRVALIPKGIKVGNTQLVENEKAQYLELRRHQRTVIAGGFNFPLHLVGDLEQGKFNNVEQQNLSFTQNVILPITEVSEEAMERDFLTPEERRAGLCIRHDLNEILRADFKTRQEGLKIQREAGALNPNEWRELEGRNPREDPGGEEYWDRGPSGQMGDGANRSDDDDETQTDDEE